MRVSYTRLDTYTQCPRKYKFYIDKAPQDPSRTLALRFGSAVHKALEFAYAKRYKGPSEERVIEYYRKLMAVETEPDVLARFEEGIPALRKYLRENNARDIRILEVERKFSMSLSNAHEIIGIIDRLDMLPDGSFEIVDYKTGKVQDAEKLKDNWQLAIYQFAKQRQLQTKRIKASFVYIMHDGHKLTYQFSKGELQDVHQAILKQISVMEKDTKFPTRVGWWCDYCSYKPICPAWTHKTLAKEVVTGKERDEELVDVQAKVDRLLAVTARIRNMQEEAAALKEALAVYANQRNLTRLFSDLGTVSFSFRRRAVYDISELIEVLRDDLLRKIIKTVDTAKLEKMLPYLSSEDRARVEGLREEKESKSVTARPHIDEDTEELLTP